MFMAHFAVLFYLPCPNSVASFHFDFVLSCTLTPFIVFFQAADKLGSINCSVLTGPCTGSCGFCPRILILNKGKHTFSNHHKHACHLGIHVFIYWDKCSNHGCNLRYLWSSGICKRCRFLSMNLICRLSSLAPTDANVFQTC
ncbi:hypothetical protein Taro_040686 [Colocasia esculenta]|uniref:Secreted protein n=1 Tax=Colocasia esculenta TaxID=4460 RepID=A0A843WTQ7_COLES|nr:hypothetical protein [Colocasia esculenta]